MNHGALMVSQVDLLLPPILSTSLYNGGTGEEVRVSWVNRAPVTSRLERNDGGGWVHQATYASGVASVDTGLIRSATRTWRVRHENGDNVSAWSAVVPDPTGLPAPTSISAVYGNVAPAGTKARVAWTNANGLYALELRKNGGTPVALAAGTSTWDDSVPFVSTDTFQTRHVYSGYESPWTANVSVNTIPAPLAPATSLYSGSLVKFAWTANGTYGNYQQRVEADTGGGFALVANVAAGTVLYDSGLAQSAARTWRVRNEQGGVVSAWTTPVADPGVLAPTSFASAYAGDTTVSLSWVNRAAAYLTEIERKDTTTWVAQTTTTAGATTYASGLAPLTGRQWRVRHTFNGFTSSWVTVDDPPLNAPSGLTITHGGSAINFENDQATWVVGNAEATGELQYWNGSIWQIGWEPLAGTSNVETDIERAAVRKWRLRHVLGAAVSAWSNEAVSPSDMELPTGVTLSVTGGFVSLAWINAVPSTTARYETRLEYNSGGSWLLATTVAPGTAGHTSSLTPLNGRQWRLRHEFNGFLSAYTAVVTEVVAASVAAPTNLRDSVYFASGNDRVRVEWDYANPSYETEVQQSANAGGSWDAGVTKSSGVQAHDTGVITGTAGIEDYRWRIRHTSGGVTSDWVGPISYTGGAA